MKKYILLSVMVLTSGMNLIAMEPSADARNVLWRDVTSKQSEDGLQKTCDVCYVAFFDTTVREYVNNEKHIKHCPNRDCTYSFINDQESRQSFTCPKCNATL